MKIVSEPEFQARFREVLIQYMANSNRVFGYVTGPGRSGAVAAVYASHMVPGLHFIPYGVQIKGKNAPQVLVVDTVTKTGATVRRAGRQYDDCFCVAFDGSQERHVFWYEAKAMELSNGR